MESLYCIGISHPAKGTILAAHKNTCQPFVSSHQVTKAEWIKHVINSEAPTIGERVIV
jgi:hypothetical protein